jgi:hypothetical protein
MTDAETALEELGNWSEWSRTRHENLRLGIPRTDQKRPTSVTLAEPTKSVATPELWRFSLGSSARLQPREAIVAIGLTLG